MSSLGSAVGSWAFSTVGIVGSSAAFANASWIVGNAVLPGVGALVGFVIGALIGNLFGAKPPPPPKADAETVLNLSTGYYELGSINQTDGGNVELVRSMAETARDSLNGVISYVTNGSRFADVANTYSPTQVYGHTADQIWVRYSGEKKDFATADEAVEWATMEAIEDTKIVGGDIFMKRAIANSRAPSMMSLMGDLQIADDYRSFVQDEVAALRRGDLKGTIEAMITKAYDSLRTDNGDKAFYDYNETVITRIMTAPRHENGYFVDDGTAQTLSGSDRNWYNNQSWGGESNRNRVDRIAEALELPQVAVGWLITLQRAQEAGITQTSESDFYGGFAGFADSLQILNLTDDALTYEQIGLTRFNQGKKLVIRYAENERGYFADSAPVLFELDDITKGGYRISSGGTSGSSSAAGRALAMASVGNSEAATFVSASGGRNSRGNDFVNHWSNTSTRIDDYRTETWSVRWTDYSRANGAEPEPRWTTVTVAITGGDDVFKSLGGNDYLRGRGGNDWLDAGNGNDTLYGDHGDDVLLGRLGTDRLEGGSGNDYLSAGAGENDTLYGQDGNDTLVGGQQKEYVYGGNGDDLIIVDASGNFEQDYYDGQGGRDTLSFERFTVAIDVDFATSFDWWGGGSGHRDRYRNFENLTGTNYDDGIVGDANANVLSGLDGDDTISGGGGRDTLEGGAGADRLTGGGDWDTVSYASSGAAVWVDLQAYEAFGGHAEGDTFTGTTLADVEYFVGSDFADTFKGQARQNNRFWGGKGDDWFVATSANSDRFYGEEDFDTIDYSEFDRGVSVNLSTGRSSDGGRIWHQHSGIEHVVGTNHTDRIHGRNGEDDYFTGGRGTDYLYGYSGNDTYVYNRGDGHDRIYETADGGGWDELILGENIAWGDLWVGRPSGTNNLQIRVNGSSAATIHVSGHFHNDYNEGGIDGIDVAGTGAVYVNDLTWIVNGSDSGVWTFATNKSGDKVSNKRDLLFGNGGNDRVFSNQSNGAYATHWEDNDNILVGGRGNDTLYASVGDDTYVFEAGDGRDVVNDKGGEDRIQFGVGIRAEDINFKVVGSDLHIEVAGDLNDYVSYVRRYGDLLNAYNGNHSQGRNSGNSLAQFGRFHWEASGEREGRTMTTLDAPPTGNQVTDRIIIQDGAHQSTTIEYVTAGGVDINLLTLDGIDWASRSSTGGSNPPPSGGTNPPPDGGGNNPPSGGGSPPPPPYGGGGGGTHLPPILLDLDGDGSAGLVGVDQSTIGVGGSATRLGWFGPEDGVLALDRNGDGVIDRAGEISFKSDHEDALTDMEGLVAFDTDGDGTFTATDDAFASFSVWQDLDQNGISSEGELRTLDQVGITSISLELKATGGRYDNSADSVVLNTASASLADGSSMTVFDTALALAAPLTDADLEGALTFSQIEALDMGPTLIEPTDELRRSFNAIMVDLDGDGFDTYAVEQSVLGRDLNDDGIRDRIGWLTSEDGFLVTDANGDGRITVGEDLVETHKELDSKKLLKGNILQQIRKLSDDYLVWRDENQDGVGDEGELLTIHELEEQGIATDLYDRIKEAQHPHSTTESPIQGIEVEWFEGLDERNAVDRGNNGRGNGNGRASFAHQRLDAMRAAEAEQASDAEAAEGASGPEASARLSTAGPDAGGVFDQDGSRMRYGGKPASPHDVGRARPFSQASAPEAGSEREIGADDDRGTATSGAAQPSSRWWLSDLRDEQTLRGRAGAGGLGALLARLDGEKDASERDGIAPRVLPQAEADVLAENQRLLQAMAAFHGSSGAAGMQRAGQQDDRSDAMERLGVAPTGSITRSAFF